MSSITKIARLKHPGVLRDFTWPADLPTFGRFNLIYGWNGSGKTTLSCVFRALEQRVSPSHAEVTLDINGHQVTGQDFPKATVPVRVFNRVFIDETVFPLTGGDLPPIFVVGTESVEKQKEVERRKRDRKDAEEKQISARSAKQEAEKNFDQFCIDRAKLIKGTLRSSEQNRYNNYDKSDFRDGAEKMVGAGDAEDQKLSDLERDKLLAQNRATLKSKLEEVSYRLPDFQAIHDRLSQLLRTTLVSAAIEALKTDPELATWTRNGLRLHRDRKSERCLFCEQTLPADRLAALEAHFNAEFEKFMENVDQFIRDLQARSKQASELQTPHKTELYDDLAAEYEAAKAKLCEVRSSTSAFLNAAVKALEEKKQRAFEQVGAALQRPDIDAEVVEKLNAVIRKHNQACDEFQTRVEEARERLAHHMIAEALEEFIRLRDAVQQTTNQVQEAEKKVEQLQAEIDRLEREIVEHRRPADELNEELCKYLGHGELRFEVKNTGYTIIRAGKPAQALSEGEKTAIALLYFLKSLHDRQFDLKNGIVVLDDPVSSLDANALYLAFGFIRARTEKAGQLIILTHNFAFFRQVRNWFHHLKGQNRKDINQRPARFYMLECAHDQNGRYACVRWLDPLLEQYESEYHYLFARIYRASGQALLPKLEENYGLPNMARRVLETFLAFRQPQSSGDLYQKMQVVQFDEAKKQRILRFLHTHSHGDFVSEPEHDLSILAEGRAVLKDLLELLKAQDEKHFTEMVKLVNQQASDEEGT